MTRQLVLASTSPYRAELLTRLGLPFTAAPPHVDEDAAKARGLSAHDLVERLSIDKAAALASAHPDALIIGSDQCAELNGKILGKPGTHERAVAQLVSMAGRTHDLWTGVAVLDARTGEHRGEVDRHRLTMRSLTREQLDGYVGFDQPLDCAGSYKIESRGVALFERIEGEDATAIVGLPLLRLTRMLAGFGVDPL